MAVPPAADVLGHALRLAAQHGIEGEDGQRLRRWAIRGCGVSTDPSDGGVAGAAGGAGGPALVCRRG